MLTSRELLAAVRAAQNIPSNYRLARLLDVPEKSVQRWNSGRHTPDDPMAVRLAEMAGLDPAGVLAAMHAQRSADGPLAQVYRAIAERAYVAHPALMAAILSAGLSASPDADAAPTAAPTDEQLNIMSTLMRLLRQRDRGANTSRRRDFRACHA